MDNVLYVKGYGGPNASPQKEKTRYLRNSMIMAVPVGLGGYALFEFSQFVAEAYAAFISCLSPHLNF